MRACVDCDSFVSSGTLGGRSSDGQLSAGDRVCDCWWSRAVRLPRSSEQVEHPSSGSHRRALLALESAPSVLELDLAAGFIEHTSHVA